MTVHVVCLNDVAGEKRNLGGLSDRRIPDTIYFTGIDASGSVNASNGVSISGANLTIADGLDIQPQGQMDIKAKQTSSGIAGYELSISGGPAGDGGGGLAGGEGGPLLITGGDAGAAGLGPGEVPGTGGYSQVAGGAGGAGSLAYPGGTGGDANINGGPGGISGGLGAGENGDVNIGSANTKKIWLGNAVDNPDVELVGTGSIKVGASVYIRSDRISFTGAGSDPSLPVAGDIWYRTDSGALRYYDGAAGGAFTLLSTSSGILNPIRTTNDLLQVGGDGSTWDAVGGVVGDPVLGPLYTEGITVVGSSKNLLWNTDGGGNIGASGANRPDYIYAKTWVGAGASTVLKADRISISGAGSDPSSLVGGDIFYRTDTGKLKYYDGVGGSSVVLLDSGFSLAGDVTGTPSATVVGNDTHSHSNSTLTGVPGAGIDTSVYNIRGNAIYSQALGTSDRNKSLVWDGSQFQFIHGAWYLIEEITLSPSQYAQFVTGVDSDTFEALFILIQGYSAASGSSGYVYLEPRIGTTWYSTSSSGYSFRHQTGIDPTITWYHGVNDVAGMVIGEMNNWDEQGWFHGDVLFQTERTYRYGGHSRWDWETYGASGGNQVRNMGFDCRLRWRTNSGPINGIRVNFSRTVYANVKLYALKKYVS